MAGYAGDVLPQQAWDVLKSDPAAVLIDVRTRPEWGFVGVPDLSAIGKEAALISWQLFPDMARNPEFEAAVEGLGIARDAPVFFLCRTGGRSRAAAIAMTAAGYGTCYNVAYGFEGEPDQERHRGLVNGWKAERLPWVQQ